MIIDVFETTAKIIYKTFIGWEVCEHGDVIRYLFHVL